MHGHDATNEAGGARDQRPPSLGLGRIIIALFWLLGAWIFVTAILDLFHAQGQPWGPRIVARLAGVDYLIAATALTHNGRRMRLVGWVDRFWRGFLLRAPHRLGYRPGVDVAFKSAQDCLPRGAGGASFYSVEGWLSSGLTESVLCQARPGGFIRPGPRFFDV